MKKFRILMVFVSLLLVCLLTGCSQENAEKGVEATTAPETTVIVEETAEPTVSPSPTPTMIPTEKPTEVPSATPTMSPTDEVETVSASGNVVTATPTATNKEPSSGMFDAWYTVKTSIAYSSGTDSDWSYGNQRKEFTASKPCYVRIGSSIVADWHWGWRYGEGEAITITYKFTGAQNCAIEVADGFLTEVSSDDPDVLIFTRTLTAKSSHEEDVVIFRYDPTQVGSISLEVIYDDKVKSQFDERNTVYFIDDEW